MLRRLSKLSSSKGTLRKGTFCKKYVNMSVSMLRLHCEKFLKQLSMFKKLIIHSQVLTYFLSCVKYLNILTKIRNLLTKSNGPQIKGCFCDGMHYGVRVCML